MQITSTSGNSSISAMSVKRDTGKQDVTLYSFMESFSFTFSMTPEMALELAHQIIATAQKAKEQNEYL